MEIFNLETIKATIESLKENFEQLLQGQEILNLRIHSPLELKVIATLLNIESWPRNPFDEIYFLVERDDHVFPMYMFKDDLPSEPLVEYWTCCPCRLRSLSMEQDEFENYVENEYTPESLPFGRTHELSMYRDGILYSIEAYDGQVLEDEEIKIIRILSEQECVDWFLKKKG